MEYAEYLRRKMDRLRASAWYFAAWERRPALIRRAGGVMRLYTGQEYDPGEYELVDGAWDHDHCEICQATISNDNYKDEIREAFTDGRNWLCPKCHRQIISGGPSEAG